ncbi:hypothetical protein [Paenalkalicoccus suaedae]|nr:hypothetical protein [Paenalkalicoccus suaedae]
MKKLVIFAVVATLLTVATAAGAAEPQAFVDFIVTPNDLPYEA